MRIPILGLALAAVPILIGSGLSRAASEQAAPVPSLSPQAISRYEQLLKSLSPGTVNALASESAMLLHTYSGAFTHPMGLPALKLQQAELEDLKARLCAATTGC